MLKSAKFSNFFYKIRRDWLSGWVDLFSFLHVKIYLLIIIILNLAIWLSTRYIAKAIGSELIALHYNVDFGINLIGEATKIYIIPFLGLIIILINLVLLNIVSRHKDRKFLAHILFLSALISNLILLAGLASIYLINFK
jgi:hypothetical protein